MSSAHRGANQSGSEVGSETTPSITAASTMMNGIEGQQPIVAATIPDDTDVREVSSDNDNERVREKLKKTTIAPSSRPGSGAKKADGHDEIMSSSTSTSGIPTTTIAVEDAPRRTRKRSHDESDEDKVEGEGGNERRRLKAHERKRSREVTEADRIQAGSGLERVKTPPTHAEESEGIAERVSSPRGFLERKRSLGKLDKEEEVDQKKKISKTEEEQRRKEETMAADNSTENEKPEAKDEQAVTKLPESSGFANTSTKSPFATANTGLNLFGSNTTSSNLFANSKFGALSGSSASPFGTLGGKSGSQSPFGAFGASAPASGFGSGSAFGPSAGSSVFGNPTFGSSAAKPQPARKPFGAPDEDKSDEDEEGSKDDGEDKKEKPAKEDDGEFKSLGFKEQDVMTGEEDETTIFKCNAKVFAFDKDTKAWKERGRGTLKLNRTTPSVDDFGLTSDDEGEKKKTAIKKSARLIMRTDGTYVVILNCPIYEGMKFGDEPPANQLHFLTMEPTGPIQIVLKVRNNSTAKELYKHITDLQNEIWG